MNRAVLTVLGLVLWAAPAYALEPLDESFLTHVQRATWRYFRDCTHPVTGLVLDRAPNDAPPVFDDAPATIAGTGFGLSALVVAVERGWVDRLEALALTRKSLTWLLHSQPHEHGFFYHFVDPATGERVWTCELSSIDTALALAGILTAGEYFRDPDVARMARALYERVDWEWMANGRETLCMGWKPEDGFLPHYWDDYAEASLMYLLAMGSPTHPLPAAAWRALRRPTGTYDDLTLVACPPLFTHQYSHLWVDFRGLHDGLMDYWANSVAATMANRRFCMDAASSWKGFGPDSWGLTACIGPDGYQAYGAPPGPTVCDGTVAPTAAGGSLAFTPRESLRALRHFFAAHGTKLWGRYGFADSFNMDRDWYARDAFAINQGPILLAAENLRTGLLWRLFGGHEGLRRGLALAGLRPGGGPPLSPTLPPPLTWRPSLPARRPVVDVPDGTDWEKAAVIAVTADDLQRGETVDPTWHARVRLLADPANLRVFLEVTDPTPTTAPDPTRPWEGDCVELFIDGRGDGLTWGGEDDAQVVVAVGAEGAVSALETFHPDRTDGPRVISGGRRPGGWDAIVDLPRATLRMGTTPGFSPVGSDYAGPGRPATKYAWFYCEPGVLLGELRILTESAP